MLVLGNYGLASRTTLATGILGAEILEVCHEDENYYDYFLIKGYEKIFLGSSEDGEIIDFLTQYT